MLKIQFWQILKIRLNIQDNKFDKNLVSFENVDKESLDYWLQTHSHKKDQHKGYSNIVSSVTKQPEEEKKMKWKKMNKLLSALIIAWQ